MNKLLIICSVLILASCHTLKNSPKKALTESESIKLQGYFVEANKQKILGNYIQAISLFEKCISIDKTNAASYYELGKMYGEFSKIGTFNLQKSEENTQKAVDLDPENVWYLMQLADIHEMGKKYKEAIRDCKALIKLKNYNMEYYQRLASLYEITKEYKNAIQVYNDIESKTSIRDFTSFRKSNLYQALGDKENAANEIEKLIKHEPNIPDYYQKLAECYMQAGNEKKVLETYEELKKIDPGNPNINLFLANYYEQKGEKEKSFEELKLAFANTGLDVDKKIQILLNYYVVTEKSDALKPQAFDLIAILTKTHPTDAKAFSIAGDFYYRENNMEEAKKNFAQALEYDKNKFAIWNQLFVIDYNLKNYADLAKNTADCFQYFPEQPLSYYFNGFANMQLKNYTSSIDALEKGKRLTFENELLIQFYALLGDVYNSIKEYEKSDLAYEEALRYDSTNMHILNNYAYYLSVRNEKLEKAESMSKKSLDLEPNSSTFADTYAWILYKMNNYEQALIWIKKSIEWSAGQESGTIIEHYGDILFKLNNKSEAIIQWKKAKELGETSDQLDRKIKDETLYE